MQRGVAALFVIAFATNLVQFPALNGERGLLPATELLEWARGSKRRGRMLGPTLFRVVRYTDRRLRALCAGGILLGALLVVGVPQLGPPWAPMLAFLALWIGYLSLLPLGRTFLGFGWEMLLCEAGFVVAFLGSDDQPPPTATIVLCWWLVFRLEFGAGMIKVRGGREWRDFTALTFHHETQPMPGPLSRQAHLLPRWFHRAEVAGNHLAQLVAPWLLFVPIVSIWTPAPWPLVVGAAGAAVVIGTQGWLILTGNYAWLNWATVVLACSAIGVPGSAPRAATDLPATIDGLPLYWFVVTGAVALLYAALAVRPIANLASPDQLMNASFNRFQLGNAYGAFGTVTRERIEIVVEGTLDDDPVDEASWREYAFRGKPGDLARLPPLVAPWHLRLDWLMWFLPLGRSPEQWFEPFLLRLLEADPATLRLLAADPFEGERPRWVRAVAYRYRFADRATFRRERVRWVRDRRRPYLGPVGLRG
nr:lipase maturation factor family protein [Agromyces seonyuensis]